MSCGAPRLLHATEAAVCVHTRLYRSPQVSTLLTSWLAALTDKFSSTAISL